jgi:hypothetical protein
VSDTSRKELSARGFTIVEKLPYTNELLAQASGKAKPAAATPAPKK